MARYFNPEGVDLADLAQRLRGALRSAPIGAVVGRTQIRDEVWRRLGCSELEAKQIVDTMVARGFLTQEKDPDGLIRWLMPSDFASS